MMKLVELFEKIDTVAKAFDLLLTTIADELPEVQAQLQAAIDGHLDTDEAMAAKEKLEAVIKLLPGAIEQIKGFAPTIATPEPGEGTESEIEPVEMPEVPDVEVPVVVDESPEASGIEGVPNMDFPTVL